MWLLCSCLCQCCVGTHWAVRRTSDCTHPAFDPVSCCCSSQPGWWRASIPSFSALAATAALQYRAVIQDKLISGRRKNTACIPSVKHIEKLMRGLSALGEPIDKSLLPALGCKLLAVFQLAWLFSHSGCWAVSFRPENWNTEQAGSFWLCSAWNLSSPHCTSHPKSLRCFLENSGFF